MSRILCFRLRRLLKGMRLGCGCTVGIYQTFAGDTVKVVEEPSRPCKNRRIHRAGQLIENASISS